MLCCHALSNLSSVIPARFLSMSRFLLAQFVCVILLPVAARSADNSLSWPFRSGPTLDGHATEADAAGLPVEFDEESGNGIRWKIGLGTDEFGHSTPIIGNGKIWLTTATADGKKQYLWAIDAASGEVLHHGLLFENEAPEPLNNTINTYASPSCALEQDAVYVHFGTYGTARVNPETYDVVWQRRDIKCRHYRGPGSSPVIHDNLLFLTFDGVDDQFLMALDKNTGDTVWRTRRSTDYGDLDENGEPKREGDLRKAYSTPSLVEVNGRMQLVSVGSRAGFAYDALTGKEIWGFRHDDFNAAAPPSFFGNLAILNTGSSKANLLAIELNETTRGDVTDTHVRWDRPKGNSRLAAPLLVKDRIYMVTHTGVGYCVDAATGEEIWKDRIGGTNVASPVTANGRIYFCNEEGDVIVINAADTFKIVAKNRLAEGTRAAPAIAAGRLYIRTFKHLYCIGD